MQQGEEVSTSKIINVDSIPEELKQLRQWVMWRYETKKGRSKPTKVPYFSVSQHAKSNDSSTWLKFDEAIRFLPNDFFDGIGFMFSSNDPYVGIDLDNCIAGSELTEEARKVVDMFSSYTEYSPSGSGLHIIVKVPDDFKFEARKDSATGIECYQKERYFTFTSAILSEEYKTIQSRQNEVTELLEDILHPSSTEDIPFVPTEEISHYVSNKEDADVLKKLFASRRKLEGSNLTFGKYNRSLYENGHQSGDFSSDDWFFAKQLAYECNGDIEQIDRIFRSSALYREKWDKKHYGNGDTYGQRTIYKAICAKKDVLDKKNGGSVSPVVTGQSEDFVFPKGYYSNNGCLYKLVEKEVRGETVVYEVFICRQTPIITSSYMNVEFPQLYHEITWTDKGTVHNEVVPAGDLAIKKELLKLSYKSLACNDNNCKELITYFDRLNMASRSDRGYLVERLGQIKDVFIHPLQANGVKIVPFDIGDKQLYEAFQQSGTPAEWLQHVLEPIKHYPRALLMVLASFASVIIKDLKLQPFIVDFSGPTSRGKTTILKVAASVWGTEHLVNEWNLTKVAAERKATFLNSFPLLIDDSKKADPKQLQGFVYNFSGGRSKGRGSVSGSQREFTWNNIAISTGESALTEYAEQAGGVAARIISITGLPFPDSDFRFFNDLYNSMEKYYGAIGMEFLNKWQANKHLAIPVFNSHFNEQFQAKAHGNEVVSRIARYYAALVMTADFLNQMFGCNIDLNLLERLFDELVEENKAIDKPKQLLEMILNDLNADRGAIYYEYEPNKAIKAVYKKGTLHLLPAYLRDMLKVEEKAIRAEWLRRGMTLERISKGKKVDYGQLKHKGKNFTCVAIPTAILEDLGFDFSEEYQKR